MAAAPIRGPHRDHLARTAVGSVTRTSR
jgi:hypothetical protein